MGQLICTTLWLGVVLDLTYEALIYGLKLARYLSIKKLKMWGDSTLSMGQVFGNYEV